MKELFIILICCIFFSCHQDKATKKITSYNPSSEIEQVIYNDTAYVLYSRAKEYSEKLEYDSAKVLLQASLQKEKNPIIYNELGIIEAALNNCDKAIEYYHEGIALDSLYWPSSINLVRCYLKQNNISKSRGVLIKMIEDCKSEYWTANAYMYLALIQYNFDRNCNTTMRSLEKAKILKDDSVLSKQYTDFYVKARTDCSN